MKNVPRYVVASTAEATTVLRRLALAGWLTRQGFTLAGTGSDPARTRLVLFGRVVDPHTARLAVSAAARGAGVVAIVDASPGVSRALIGDLSRLGPVYRDPGLGRRGAAAVDPVGVLIPEQRALLERLANGETIAAAAAAEFLSLRTANRRMAQARQVLGVRTTREAVVAYVHQRRPG
jgi:DNA-binding NarL/FixJ family response regulator